MFQLYTYKTSTYQIFVMQNLRGNTHLSSRIYPQKHQQDSDPQQSIEIIQVSKLTFDRRVNIKATFSEILNVTLQLCQSNN